ncbi:MAG: hypothetical protein AB8B93_13725 [Pseudomonadales bacterium]
MEYTNQVTGLPGALRNSGDVDTANILDPTCVSNSPGLIASSTSSNVGKGAANGVELATNWLPAKNLSLQLSYTQLDLDIEARGQAAQSILRIAVADTGIGIRQAAIAGLFDAFTQADFSIVATQRCLLLHRNPRVRLPAGAQQLFLERWL